MKGNISIIGNFGFKENIVNGQTIKTRNLLDLLTSKSNNNISYFDTSETKSNKLTLLSLLKIIFTANKIIYMPAHSNLKLLFPLLYLICKIRNVDIIYVVIGGWLPEFIKNKWFHQWALRNIKVIFCETNQMKVKLESWYNYKNIKLLPNFRINSNKPIFANNENQLKIVFMSRIIIEKGLDVIFRFLDFNNNLASPANIEVTFYGPIAQESLGYFNSHLDKFDNAKYEGILDPNQINNTLNHFDVLVLPTRYPGEGFPGAILDAYISGIPVIVSNWKDIAEFVEIEKTGFVFELNEEENFGKFIYKLYNNNNLLKAMKLNSFEKSKEYSSENCWNILSPYLTN